MVTSAHRAEALTDLRAAPPPYVIWDEQVWRVDAIPDSLVLGPEMMVWLRRNYEVAQRHSGFLLLRYGPAGGTASE